MDPSLQWFYATEDGGTESTNAETVRDLLQRGVIGEDTLIWNKNFGRSWKPIKDTELAVFINYNPPPIPIKVGLFGRLRRWGRPILFAGWLVAFCGAIWWLNRHAKDLPGAQREPLDQPGAQSEPLAYRLPDCISAFTKDLAKQTLENAPLSKLIKITVLEIQDEEQIAYDPINKKRSCRATAFLNSGKHEILYTLGWLNERDRKVYLQIDRFSD